MAVGRVVVCDVGVLLRVVELVCIFALVSAAVIGRPTTASGQWRGRVGGRHVERGRVKGTGEIRASGVGAW